MPDFRDLDPARLKPGLVTGDGDLKPGLVTPAYTGGRPTAANQVKPSLLLPNGDLKPGLILGDDLKPSLVTGGAPLWTPESIDSPNLLQNLGEQLAYASNPIGGIPVLESSVGTAAVPRGQRCVLFDGVDDFATRGARVTVGTVNAVTACARIKTSNASALQKIICGEYTNTGVNRRSWLMYLHTNGCLRMLVSVDGSTLCFRDSNIAVNDNQMHSVAVTFDGASINLYIDGVLDNGPLTGTIPASIFDSTAHFEIGRIDTDLHFPGSMCDVRVYSIAKNSAFALAYHNQHLTPSTLDRTGLLGAWWLNEESGTTHYDWSGNGRHLTATNVTTATYHATDSGVRYNAANELGYTLSGSVVIPRNESLPTQDASGGALQFAGPIALSGVMEVPCLTVSGTEYLDLPHLTGSETVVSKVGTSTVSIAAGRINLTAGTVSSILLSDGTRLPLQEGPGSSNTNRTCYNVDGTGRHATLTNGTVATMWAGRLNTVRDWCMENGGSIAANGAFVPGRIGSNLDAAGNVKQFVAGKHRNPFSRLIRNPFGAPSLTINGATPTTRLAPGDVDQPTAPANTKFTSGYDRYFATRIPLVGSELSNAEDYVA